MLFTGMVPRAEYLTISQPPPPETSCHNWIKHLVLKNVIEDGGKVCVQDILEWLKPVFTEDDGLTFGHVWAVCRGAGMIPMKGAPFSSKERTYLRWPVCSFVISNFASRLIEGMYIQIKVSHLAKKYLFSSFEEVYLILKGMEQNGLVQLKLRKDKSDCEVKIYWLPQHAAYQHDSEEVHAKIERV